MSTATPSQTETARGRVERPATLAEASDLLRGTSGSVLFRGGGTKQQWGGRVADPELVVETSALSGILTHNPADMTASVGAGTPLRELQEHVAGDRQWFGVDPPSEAGGASVGGLLATGDFGPARLRYGGMRDLVIGATVVLADGTVARSGGHVIKNVAGYDLTKVMHGSLGSLALVAEVVVRLHPLPSATMTVVAPADAHGATAAAMALMAGPLEPTAICWLSTGDPDEDPAGSPGRLLVRMDGAEDPVENACEKVVAALREHGLEGSTHRGDDADGTWRSFQDGSVAGEGETLLRVSGLPSESAALAAAVERAGASSGVGARIASHVALGVHTVALQPGDAAAQAAVATAVREHAAARGSSVLLRERPPAVDEHVDALGPPPSTGALLRRLKDQLDPDARCAPGRFAGWY